jgi:UDP-glucuronate decarboxylase
MSNIVREDIENIARDVAAEAKILNGKTLLITGGAGFLGNYFISVVDYLNKNVLEKPCRIISLDNFITGVKYNIEEGPNFISLKHDIKDPIKIEGDVDFIIHAAGIASPKFYRKFKIETIDVATLGTKNILELAKQKKSESVLFFSSSEVYGDPDPEFVPTPETYVGRVSCVGPRSNYDESKRLGEAMSIAYFETHGIPVKIVRPFNVFGPGMRLDDYRVIPNFAASLINKTPLPIYGSGNHTRTFCYVSDALAEFFKILLSELNGEVFNVGNDSDEITIQDLARLMIEIHNSRAKFQNEAGINDAYSSADPKRRCPDLTKVRTKLNFQPKVDLQTGLKRFIEWAKDSKV